MRYNVYTETGAQRVTEGIVAQRKKEESFVPPPTPERQLSSSSGWCITSDHTECKYQFNHGRCGCNCHKEKNVRKC
jgi:hypothetical protein